MLDNIHIGDRIGHKTYGTGQLIGWNPDGAFEGMGCATFQGTTGTEYHTLIGQEYKEGLWWLILGGSEVAVDAPRPTVEV